MQEVKKKLAALLEKKDWKEADKRWLLEYLESARADELQDLMFDEFNKEEFAEKLNKDASKQLLQSIHNRIGIKNKKTTRIYTIWQKSIAAAVVTGLCILGSYLLIKTEWKKEITKIQAPAATKDTSYFKNEVAPGGNKAVLTLADGSSIVLDDAQNGNLVRQGKTKVLKFDGKLVYRASSRAGADEILYNIISTPRGGEYKVLLPDGSQVWLNAASSLRFPTSFSGKERRVEITGEAYFEVAKKADMPFIVSVSNSEIRVLGTHFNIMAYNEEALLKTTLLEGSVQFTSGNNQALLRPGQQSQLVKNGQIKILSTVNVEEVVAWKNGMFHFEKMDIETLMRQIARWYNIDVEYQLHQNYEKFIADIPRDTNLSDVLKALQLTGKVKFMVDGKKVTVKN